MNTECARDLVFRNNLFSTANVILMMFSMGFLSLSKVHGAAYIFAGDSIGLNTITHPSGYSGDGADLTVNVCVLPGTANASSMEIPTKNVINTYNALVATSPNLEQANVPQSEFDFESVLLHEVGHCLGAAHTNVASQSGVTGADTDYTNSTKGIDNSFTFDEGTDGVIGSYDDGRGDDANLLWFEKATNDPFSIASVADGSTFSRDLNDLPQGHSYASNGSRDVALALGYPPTEAVMNQGTFSGQARRTLSADDVNGINFAKSGVDRMEGTSDDYTLTLHYFGISDSPACDITVQFDASAGFAFCSVGGTSIAPDHISITSANIFFDTDAVTWFFNQVTNNSISTCGGEEVTVDLNLGQSPTSGNDVILGTPSADTIYTLTGDDIVCGGLGDDTIYGQGGDDVMYGEGGADMLVGGPGNDVLSGGEDGDTLYGGSGHDELTGNDGDDILYGQGGNDILHGELSDNTGSSQSGYDTIYGNSGSDTISTGPGGGYAVGGGNNDNITGSSDSDTLFGNSGLDIIHGLGGDDLIYGGNARDYIYGGPGDDYMTGNGANDFIFGDGGNDTLLGGVGDDTVDGGGDIDDCNGQGGIDTFLSCEITTN